MKFIITDSNAVAVIDCYPSVTVTLDGIQIKRQYSLSLRLATSDFRLSFTTSIFSHIEDIVRLVFSRPCDVDSRDPNSRDCLLATLEYAQMYYMETGDKSVFGEVFSFLQ